MVGAPDPTTSAETLRFLEEVAAIIDVLFLESKGRELEGEGIACIALLFVVVIAAALGPFKFLWEGQ